ncbi:caspase domain-containing protein [Armillaria novae-zelandiae]|uniref:Caspase domain-containing protein n=1 Tax=Armillaria novae-zelandiae TaxID=153914 RepID=A0AA39P0R8_9AGAR|nr:caspase domain-containing protein [Armillaria novae-zelandiae]
MGASGPQKELTRGSKPTTSDTDHNHSCSYLPGASVPCVQAMSCGNYESSRRKRALCIGINYSDPKHALRGCIEDVKNICGILQENGYEDITVLTDSKEKPTRSNILDALSRLFRDAQPNDSLFLHYSGHGDQILDTDGDEIDGQDERIVGCDGFGITDDELHKMLQSLPSGCQLTALFDSCHSGTILDLPYTFSCCHVFTIILSNPNQLDLTNTSMVSFGNGSYYNLTSIRLYYRHSLLVHARRSLRQSNYSNVVSSI